MLMEICAFAVGGEFRSTSNAVVKSRAFSPRIYDSSLGCLRFVGLRGIRCCRKEQSSNSCCHKVKPMPSLRLVAVAGTTFYSQLALRYV
jgi:hypothetical protein